MSIASISDLLNAWPGAQILPIFKNSVISGLGQGQSLLSSHWLQTGYPAAGATPSANGGTGAQCTKATTGGWQFNNPVSGFSYLVRAHFAPSLVGPLNVQIFDRYAAAGGLSGTVITEQDFATKLTVPARGTAKGARMFMEVYTALGATASTVTANYDDITGTNYTTTPITVPGSMGPGLMLEIPLVAGTSGIQSLYGATLSVSTGTAGNWGITLGRLIAEFDLVDYMRDNVFSALECGMARIPNDACLWVVTTQPFSVSRPIAGSLAIVQG